ncbi:MAG: PVC-type heme-binding CxxCH protein [Planctomycetota bacterium]
MKRWSLLFLVFVCGAVAMAWRSWPEAAQLELASGSRVVLLGNSLAERMQHDGWLETYVQAARPEDRIVFRNHGFAGDTISERPRSQGYLDPHGYLEVSRADVILAFFGYNESYANNPDAYRGQLSRWVEETLEQRYNGKSPPQIVLFSPLAHEYLRDPNLPTGVENNKRLSAYAQVTAAVAESHGLPYVDLFAHSSEIFDDPARLTINGIHLNSEGNRRIAIYIVRALFGLSAADDDEQLRAIRAAVLDKNKHWFRRYRATDGNDVWGGRSKLTFVDEQSNKDVLAHELTMLDVLTANRDAHIWAIASGNDEHVIDDSNVPAPIPVTSNVGGGSASSSADKEGQLRYHTPSETVAQLVLEPGLQANVFASEEMFPELVNPVQTAIDTKGRLWVAAWPTYPKWAPLQQQEDKLLILPDDDRDGVADRAIVFAEVANPTGFEFWGGGVIVASAPDLIFLRDTDGDDRADVRIPLLHGLDSADTHHAANGLIYGPGGNLYYQRGVFHVSNVETPWQTPQLHTTSGMYRFNPRTFEFSFHATNSPNPHGICFDRWGNHFATDGTGGAAYQVRPGLLDGFEMQKLLDHTVRPVAASGILSSAHFPAHYQGNFLILNTIGFLGIKRYTLATDEDGDVWGTEAANLLVSPTDRNFRPTDLEIGDDGALYVADWQNVIIGHMQHHVRDPNRDHEHGRVYRIVAANRPMLPHTKVDGAPIPTLLDRLTDPTNGIRHRARIELSERDTQEVMVALAQWRKQWDATRREHAGPLLEALWVQQQHNVRNLPLMRNLLRSPEARARVAAATVERFWSGTARTDATMAEDPTPRPQTTPVAQLKARGFGRADLDSYARGAQIYVRESHCVTCHQLDGSGTENGYPPIVENDWVLGDEERLIKLTLRGLTGELQLDGVTYNAAASNLPPMTAFRDLLDDEEVAAVLTYVRNSFGNVAAPVSAAQVKRVRESIENWGTPYTVEELLAPTRR